MRIASNTYSSRSNVVRMITRVPARSGSSVIAAGGLEPVHARHPDVHQHDVRPGRAHDGDGLLAVGRLAHDLDVVLGVQQRPQPGAQQGLVVGEHDTDHVWVPSGNAASTRTPPEGAALTVRVPPRATARSRMPRSPLPGSSTWTRGPAVPSSSTRTVSMSGP